MKIRNRSVWLLLLTLSTFGAACRPQATTNFFRSRDEVNSLSKTCQEMSDTLKSLTDGLEIPDHFQQENAVKDGTEFDTNRYFTVLHHLSMEPGYSLDYVYYFQSLRGFPILYARPEEQTPYASFVEWVDAAGDQPMPEAVAEYLTHIRADGTDEAYLQLAILQLLGGQFYLYWHANYNDAQIICNKADLEELLAATPWYEQENTLADLLTPAQQRQMRAADVTPQVEIGDDSVRVRMTFFSHWGGLFEGIWTISRSFPHQVELETRPLVEYESGIRF